MVLNSGACVTIIGRDNDRLKNALGKLQTESARCSGSALDVTKSDEFSLFLNKHTHFDHIVSMLGGAISGGFLDNTTDEIEKVVRGKFIDNLKLANIAIEHLNKNGSIIFTSGSGGSPATASGAYIGNLSINKLVQGLALELAPDYRTV
ncbi:short chain dehydrogenase [Leuconostoc suionicum]|uniref:Short chain dehydrogenase n=1 Tax=Leuconostoc suionicum TaxID=1511761 RepID=A0A2N9KGC9_9LACO|nr:SDR family NAD(P)-dependent oxidoreductase [Leuconostoc suionicum]SPD95083.1 short chain dehydrogenase [Leuconostoc suionicum]SPE09877.1 short chain dehydrogenase [Leuconostoc suionicum]SPH05686.1 short chain dehydrogenase [Leuconostoc suionicum]